jgi:RNAse (barnase) inhibitor barstar
MAVFSQDDFERLDFKLLQNSFVTLYFRQQFLSEDINALKKLGYEAIEFDASLWKSECDFFDVVSQNLKFPSYFGRNLNALNDCLGEIDISDNGGLVISFLKYDAFHPKSSGFKQAVLDIIAINARQNLLFGKRLICLVQSDDPKISFSEVGAQPVIWNPREWMNNSRGL